MGSLIDRKISAEWLIDKAWPLAWMLFGGSITAASISLEDILNEYRAIGIAVAFAVGSLFFTAMHYLWNRVAMQRISIRIAQNTASNSMVNPMESRFDKRTIKLSEFYDPFYLGHKRKTFTDCRIEGPGLLLLLGGTVFGCELKHCQVVIIKEDTNLYGITVLSECSISGGSICNCTLLMSRAHYDSTPSFHGNVQIIHA